ncbi:MAG: hypothetical protein IT375_14750 [Polyangiaceae bacterium]|nr:hypothetical protein [Polyangiaceae bacterium]
MDPNAAAIAKWATKGLATKLLALAKRNDEQLERDRVELAIAWGAELKSAFPQVVADLERRIEDVDQKIQAALEDPQLPRVLSNFGFEAAREAIDERRRMLAHAAAGIVDPDLPVERKARVERTLRELDPIDVRALYGIHLAVRSARYGALFSVPSGDVLVASGCVRIGTSAGGFGGGGASHSADVTQLGHDVLRVLRSYVRSRGAPFPVPGRELAPGDRSEEEARAVLVGIPSLSQFLSLGLKRERRISASYHPKPTPPATTSMIQLFVHDWSAPVAALADALTQDAAGSELTVNIATQPYTPHVGEPYDLHRVEISGPHDLLRYAADDCEAYWP